MKQHTRMSASDLIADDQATANYADETAKLAERHAAESIAIATSIDERRHEITRNKELITWLEKQNAVTEADILRLGEKQIHHSHEAERLHARVRSIEAERGKVPETKQEPQKQDTQEPADTGHADDAGMLTADLPGNMLTDEQRADLERDIEHAIATGKSKEAA